MFAEKDKVENFFRQVENKKKLEKARQYPLY